MTSEDDAASPSCAIDLGNQGARSCADVARLTGLTKRRIQQLVKQALESVKDKGVDVSEFEALLRQEERGR